MLLGPKFVFHFKNILKSWTAREKWGKPFAALLGAVRGQLAFGLPAIGGKDSMSGTFHNIHVPPTLIAFGVSEVLLIMFFCLN